MDPAHYAGLLRVGRQAALPVPPRFDPGFARLGEDGA